MENLHWIGVSLFVAGFVMGISGFGFAIVAIGMMSFFWPIPNTVALIFIYSLPINTILLFQLRQNIVLRRVLPQVVAAIPGAAVGAVLFLHAEEALLKQMVGVVLMLFAAWSLLQRSRLKITSRFFSPLAGFLAGVLGGAVYMPGPPIIVYNTLAREDRYAFKADTQLFFFFTNFILLCVFLYCGLQKNLNLQRSLLFSPIAIGGLLAGSALFSKIDNALFKKIILALLGLMGVILFFVNAS